MSYFVSLFFMNKFLLKILLFVLPVLTLLLLLEISIKSLPNNYSYKKRYLDSNSNTIKVLFLGNSHAYYGINPSYIHENSFNASYVSQSINYDYKILQKYRDNWKNLAFVCIPLDYSTLYNRLEYGSENFRKKNYANYFEIPSTDFFWKNIELVNGKISENCLRLYRAYKKRKKSGMNDISCSKLGWGKWAKTKIDINIAGKIAALRQQLNSNNFLNKNVADFKDVISFLKLNNTQLVLYTPPACKAYIQSFDADQFEIIRNIGLDLAKNNSNVTYFDFMPDSSFSENDFHDGDHLCIEGAQKLSKKIDSVLNEMLSKKN